MVKIFRIYLVSYKSCPRPIYFTPLTLYRKDMVEYCYIKIVQKQLFLNVLQNAQVFSYEYCATFKNTFFKEHLGRLLLNISHKIPFVIEPKVWCGL